MPSFLRLSLRSAGCVLALLVAQTAGAQQRSIRTAAPEMVAYFSGAWHCAGSFSNGRPIAAAIAFSNSVGGAWLSSTHDDDPPGSYHALSLWGVRASGGFVAYIADSQGGMRRFAAADGWKNDQTMLARDTTASAFSERFTYARQTPSVFKMTYEVTRDTGATWHMGDTLSCTRKP
jgi:hypothetical protein